MLRGRPRRRRTQTSLTTTDNPSAAQDAKRKRETTPEPEPESDLDTAPRSRKRRRRKPPTKSTPSSAPNAPARSAPARSAARRSASRRGASKRGASTRGARAAGAAEKAKNDGKQDCNAALKIGRTWYRGHTQNEAGHAEMDALRAYIESELRSRQDEKEDDAITGIYEKFRRLRNKLVNCPDKACCLRCSRVLDVLEIEPSDDNTSFSNKTMGATQWGTSNTVKKFLAAAGIDVKKVSRLTNDNPCQDISLTVLKKRKFKGEPPQL